MKVDAGAAQTAAPGAAVTLKATADAQDGSVIQSYVWAQVAGAPATLILANAPTTTATLANAAAYKAELFKDLEVLDRWVVQAINPHSLSSAKAAVFEVTVTTTSGKYKARTTVNANLPFVVNGGIQNVATNQAVLLHGKNQPAYKWTLTAPSGSTATLSGDSEQNPSFLPDVAGKYVLAETNSNVTLDVYAGTWAGAISGLDDKGRPLAAGCTSCHGNAALPLAIDKFTDWRASGHAEIFQQNIDNPAGHWAINCAACHTVGYNPDAKNGGFDEAVAAEGWKVPPHGDVGTYAKMLTEFPKTAGLANIQCENCHGPNNSAAHMDGKLNAERISLSADVCGACHGEPARHGRFQQWEESGHAGASAVTPERGVNNAHCGRCHSGQGFLAWIKQPDMTKQIQGASGNATAAEMTALGMSADSIQPITCAACHDSHNVGTVTGDPPVVNLRIQGSTDLLPAGFKAEGVGRGALCITCHNTRNAIHGDLIGPPTSYSAPHTAAQGDVLMGENAYFVETGARSRHSYIKDTCVTCHMELSPPPAEFSYQGAGTNHSFEASPKICTSCHGAFDGGTLEEAVHGRLEELGEAMGAYLMTKLPDQVTIQGYTPTDVLADKLVVEKSNIASVFPAEPHGQQGFLFEFKSPVTLTYTPTGGTVQTVSVTETEVRLGDITTDGTAKLIPASDLLVRAGWNFFLIEGDGSGGIHNPSWTFSVLNGAIDALK